MEGPGVVPHSLRPRRVHRLRHVEGQHRVERVERLLHPQLLELDRVQQGQQLLVWPGPRRGSGDLTPPIIKPRTNHSTEHRVFFNKGYPNRTPPPPGGFINKLKNFTFEIHSHHYPINGVDFLFSKIYRI